MSLKNKYGIKLNDDFLLLLNKHKKYFKKLQKNEKKQNEICQSLFTLEKKIIKTNNTLNNQLKLEDKLIISFNKHIKYCEKIEENEKQQEIIVKRLSYKYNSNKNNNKNIKKIKTKAQKQRKNNNKQKKKKGNFVCDFCGKSFGYSSNFYVHRRIHTGERPHKCNECGKRFINTSALKEHLRVHTGERPYECHLCHFKFRTAGALRNHRLKRQTKCV